MNNQSGETFYECNGCGKVWLEDDCILSPDGIHCPACGEKLVPFFSEKESYA